MSVLLRGEESSSLFSVHIISSFLEKKHDELIKKLSPQICEHVSSVMVQAALTTRLSSRWGQEEAGYQPCLPLCSEEPVV